MEKKKEKDEITIGIELTIEVPDSEKPPKVTFNVKGPKKKLD